MNTAPNRGRNPVGKTVGNKPSKDWSDVAVIIPAWNEEITIASVVEELPQNLRAIVVADNGSTDETAARARDAGAVVVPAPRRGYGSACLAGLEWCRRQDPPIRAVVFVDGDGSDDPRDFDGLITPVLEDEADLVIGSRATGEREPGSVLPQARIGNWIASTWIRLVSGVRFTDLGPFRAADYQALESIRMEDPNWGWTVEMQIKAARAGLRCHEIPVRNRHRRGGQSKVTGTIRGTIGASVKIIWSLLRYSTWRP